MIIDSHEVKRTIKHTISMSSTYLDKLSKLKDAGKIVTAAMQHVRSLLVPGANIPTLCAAGDTFMLEATKKVYSKVERGIAYPTSISPEQYRLQLCSTFEYHVQAEGRRCRQGRNGSTH